MKKSRVAVIRCNSYDKEEVSEAIKRGLGLLGGIGSIIGKKDNVLLKPNLLSGKRPGLISPHPAVFEGVIDALDGYRLSWGDSPAFESPKKAAKGSGLLEVAEKHRVRLADFSKKRLVKYKNGVISKEFQISKGVLDANAIVSISKMKTHQLTNITGAVKNTFGCVHGGHKPEFHVKFPSAVGFSRMLVDLNMLLKPKLHIMDGIVAMQGNGPASGSPKKMNVILMSEDPVALDTIFCRMINLNPDYAPTVFYGDKMGLGTKSNIETVGDPVGDFVDKKFRANRKQIRNQMTRFAKLMGLLTRRPVIAPEKCIKCGACVKVCPVKGKAVDFKNGKGNPPIYDYSKCIRCFCCQEVCPESAISVKTPWLGRILLYRNEKSKE